MQFQDIVAACEVKTPGTGNIQMKSAAPMKDFNRQQEEQQMGNFNTEEGVNMLMVSREGQNWTEMTTADMLDFCDNLN